MTFRTAFNSVAPRRFYSPAYQPGTHITVGNDPNKKVMIQRFDGDDLFYVNGGTELRVTNVTNGFYSGGQRNNDFRPAWIDGEPHYELEASGNSRFVDHQSEVPTAFSSRIFVAARLMDTMSIESRLVRKAA